MHSKDSLIDLLAALLLNRFWIFFLSSRSSTRVQSSSSSTAYIFIADAYFAEHLLDSDIDIGKEIFDANFWGVLRKTKAFAALLVKARGTMVTIGSICAYLNVPYTGIYNATKAAVHILDEPLRLELAPLGVKVLTVITGSIETKIRANVTTSPLPADSYYKALEDTMSSRAAGDDGIVRVGPNGYAENVVSDILGGATGKTFRGKNATVVRYGSVMLPMSYVDHTLTAGTGFDKLSRK